MIYTELFVFCIFIDTMFKSIPQSNISIRDFPTHKEWTVTNTQYPVISATNEVGIFDPDTSDFQHGVYTDPLYHSIKNKYYNAQGNVFNQYGIMRNPAEWQWERYFGDTIYVIKIPQLKYGEQIKKGSVKLTDLDNTYQDGANVGQNILFKDDSFGNIQSEVPTYRFIEYDDQTNIMKFEDQSGSEYNVFVSSFDINSGFVTFTLSGDTDIYYIGFIDFETNVMTVDKPLIFDDTVIGDVYNGNVFYDDGLIVLTHVTPFTNYTLTYNSVQTIHETEILVNVNKGEFNYSQNPTAVNVVVGKEYDFETTKITNVRPAGTVHIKEIESITQKSKFNGSIGSSTGSWDDYYTEATSDPTGSYLTSYITTIGLYDENQNMVAIAKLPKPIKKLPNYDISFLIRFDT